jgi:capsular polysaccharide biosynthesis protein
MEDKIYIQNLFKKLFQYKLAIAFIMLGATSFLITLSFLIPKTYRAEFEINVYSKYFKNGIISEVVPSVSSMKEMTDTIDSKIKEVMSDNYIDELGIEYGFYSEKLSSTDLTNYSQKYNRAKERAKLREKFKLFGTGAQSYAVYFSDKDPMISLEVSKKVLDKIKNTFVNDRIDTIEYARKSLLTKLESLNLTRKITDDEIASNALASKNPQVLKSELAKVESDMGSLLKQFNKSHPRIQKLIARKKTILNWLSEFNAIDTDDSGVEYAEAPLIMSGDKDVASEIASKLYIRYNNLNIALEIERKNLHSYIGVIKRPQLPTTALFPKKRIFASLGFVLGLALCFIYIFYREIMAFRKEDYLLLVTQELKTTYFGDISSSNEERFLKVDQLQDVVTNTQLLSNDKGI